MITVPNEYEAGNLKIKALHKFMIPVVNNTSDKLEVTFKTSCGCSSPKPEKASLAPAEAIQVEVSIAKTSKMENVYVKLFSIVTHVNGVGMVNPPKNIADQLNHTTKINFNVR